MVSIMYGYMVLKCFWQNLKVKAFPLNIYYTLLLFYINFEYNVYMCTYSVCMFTFTVNTITYIVFCLF